MKPEERGSMFEGDIVLQKGQLGRSGILGENYRWPNKTVYYDFSGIFGEQNLLFPHIITYFII